MCSLYFKTAVTAVKSLHLRAPSLSGPDPFQASAAHSGQAGCFHCAPSEDPMGGSADVCPVPSEPWGLRQKQHWAGGAPEPAARGLAPQGPELSVPKLPQGLEITRDVESARKSDFLESLMGQQWAGITYQKLLASRNLWPLLTKLILFSYTQCELNCFNRLWHIIIITNSIFFFFWTLIFHFKGATIQSIFLYTWKKCYLKTTAEGVFRIKGIEEWTKLTIEIICTFKSRIYLTFRLQWHTMCN